MICMHFDTIDDEQDYTKTAKSNKNIVGTEIVERKYEDSSNEGSSLIVDNQGWFDGNKKRFFPYSKRDEKQVLNLDFHRGGI